MIQKKDEFIKRCPRLGGDVTFIYCINLTNEDNIPCWKIFDCWWESFDVYSYLQDQLPEDIFNELLKARPTAKVTSLVGLIDKIKKNN